MGERTRLAYCVVRPAQQLGVFGEDASTADGTPRAAFHRVPHSIWKRIQRRDWKSVLTESVARIRAVSEMAAQEDRTAGSFLCRFRAQTVLQPGRSPATSDPRARLATHHWRHIRSPLRGR